MLHFNFKRQIERAFAFSLICIFLFSTSCVTYRNMRPTGKYKTLNREKVKEVYSLVPVHLPELDNPSLIVEFRKYHVYKEHRKVEEYGKKKTYSKSLTWAAVTAASTLVTIKGVELVETAQAQGKDTDVGGAILVGIAGPWAAAGLFLTVATLLEEGKPAYREMFRDIEIKDEKNFEPVSNVKVKIKARSFEKEWESLTNSNGRLSFDVTEIWNIAEIKDSIRQEHNLQINFQSYKGPKVSNTFIVPSTFFTALDSFYAVTRPPDLNTSLKFDDSKSRNPNQMIDGAEESSLIVSVENFGEGQALNVKLLINSNNPNIKVTPTVDIGTISPRARIEKRIPLSATEDILDGKTTFVVQTKEQRREFDAPLRNLEIPVRHLDKPKITWVRPSDYRLEIKEETARISAIITSESEIEETKILVNGVEVYRNGGPVNTDFRGAARVAQAKRHNINNLVEFTVDAEVQLHPLEESDIIIYAKNTSIGVTSEKRIIYYKVPKYDLYLLSIGISNYKDKDFDLEFADDDAQAISDIFETQRGKLFNNIFIKELYNAEATRTNILRGLKWLENKNNPKDVTLVFIAAHGKVDNEGNFFIVPSDGSLNNVSQGVTWNDIVGTLRNLAGTRILFLDACHSGMMADYIYATRDKGRDVNDAIKYIADAEDNIIIFMATTGKGFSQESPQWGHGAFTKALIAGLKEGKAETI